MLKQLPVTAIVCSDYQKLLKNSAAARDAWSKLREEICWAELIPKEAVAKLLHLQAKYARAHTLLQKHMNNCERCQPVSSIA